MAVALVGLMATAVAGVYEVSQRNYMRASSLEAAQDGARVGLDRMANELRLIGSYWCTAPNCNDAITAATASSITFMANVDNVDALSASNGAEVVVSGTASGTSVPLNISTTAINAAFDCYSNSSLNDFIYIANGGTRAVRQIVTNGTDNNCTDNSTLTLVSNLNVTYLQGSIVRDVKTITYARNASATSTCLALTCLTRKQGGDSADPIVDNVTGLTFTYFLNDGLTTTTTPALIREIQIDLTVQSPPSPDGCVAAAPPCRRMTTRVKPRNLP